MSLPPQALSEYCRQTLFPNQSLLDRASARKKSKNFGLERARVDGDSSARARITLGMTRYGVQHRQANLFVISALRKDYRGPFLLDPGQPAA